MHPAGINFLVNAVIFAGFGLLLLIDPTQLKSMGVELPTATALSEIRGFYGGTQLGLAAMFATAATRLTWARPILFAQFTILTGMAIGRFAGILVDGFDNPAMLGFALAEVFGAGVAVYYLRHPGTAVAQ